MYLKEVAISLSYYRYGDLIVGSDLMEAFGELEYGTYKTRAVTSTVRYYERTIIIQRQRRQRLTIAIIFFKISKYYVRRKYYQFNNDINRLRNGRTPRV